MRLHNRLIAASALALAALLPAPAAVRWLNTVNDFGAFREDDGKVTCTFRFVNQGPDAVTVRAARASCGCTTPSFTKTPVEPGDTGEVRAAFNPTGRPGRFSKTITVDIAGAGAGPRQVLTVKGVVIGSSNTLRSRYPIEAGRLKLRSTQVPFGTVLKGKAKSAFVEVYNSGTDPVVPRWEGMPPYIRVAASQDTVPPGEQVVYSLVLTPTETSLYGILTDSVFISADSAAPTRLDITAILEEDFSTLTPGQRKNAPVVSVPSDRINFDTFPADQGPQTRTMEITNEGKSDLLVRRIYTTDPGVTVSVSRDKIKKGKSATVTVTVDPTLLPVPLLNARIQLITNDPESPLTLLRAVGVPEGKSPSGN